MTRLPILAAAALALAGCSHTVQTTSGQEYLSRYADSAPQLVPFGGQSIVTASETKAAPTEAELIRQAASVEPILKFPARFGLARIERGRLTTVPADESPLWAEFAERYASYGSFTPVDPVVAEFTRALVASSSNVPTTIRLGAARQHLDAVLIYEVSSQGQSNNTGLAFADLTILGGAILPTRDLKAGASVNALLVDVRNGYPYGTASAQSDLSELSTSWGSDARTDRLEESARRKAVANLMPEVDAMFRDLVGELIVKRGGS